MNHIKKVNDPNTTTVKNYSKALKEIGNSEGLFQTATQARPVKDLNFDQKEIKIQYLQDIENGPMEKYDPLLKGKKDIKKSLGARDTENLLLRKINDLIVLQEKFLKLNQEENDKILKRYNKHKIDVPIESLDSVIQNYHKIKKKEKIIKGHIKKINEDIKEVKSDIKITEYVRNSYSKLIGDVAKHYEPQLEKNRMKAQAILEEYKTLELSESLEDIDLGKLPKDENYSRITALKEKYEKINHKINLLLGHIEDKEKELSQMDQKLKDLNALLTKKNKAKQAHEASLERCEKEIGKASADLPFSPDSYEDLMDIKESYNKNLSERKEIESKLAKEQEKLETLRTEIDNSKLATMILNKMR